MTPEWATMDTELYVHTDMYAYTYTHICVHIYTHAPNRYMSHAQCGTLCPSVIYGPSVHNIEGSSCKVSEITGSTRAETYKIMYLGTNPQTPIQDLPLVDWGLWNPKDLQLQYQVCYSTTVLQSQTAEKGNSVIFTNSSTSMFQLDGVYCLCVCLCYMYIYIYTYIHLHSCLCVHVCFHNSWGSGICPKGFRV